MFSLHIDTARTWRGGQNQVLLTVLGLRALGHRAALVAHPDGELRRRASEGHDLYPLAPHNEMDLRAGWRLGRLVQALQPDIVHAHDPHGVAMAAVALSMSPREPGPPLLAGRRVDFHLKRNAFSRWKYRRVSRFVCASEAIRKMLVADGIPEEATVTVHEGISLRHVDAAPPLDLCRELVLPHVPIIGNIGALVPHKGQRHLIDAAAIVVRQVPEVQFLILGEGELHATLERQIHHHHLERHVHLLGFRLDPLSVLKGFDVFVMSSVTEGLGTSTLDAMAASKAVVATRAGGLPEIVQHERTGLLVPPRDDRALAEAMLRLLKDQPLRQRMGTAGRARVSERFTAERMVEQTAAVYAQVVAEGRHRAGTRAG
jgi:glycosyltransferase involved in cell wall biosynthesis